MQHFSRINSTPFIICNTFVEGFSSQVNGCNVECYGTSNLCVSWISLHMHPLVLTILFFFSSYTTSRIFSQHFYWKVYWVFQSSSWNGGTGPLSQHETQTDGQEWYYHSLSCPADEPRSQQWRKSLLISKGVGMQVEGVWRVAGSRTGLRGTLKLVKMPVYTGDASGANDEGCMPVWRRWEWEQEAALSWKDVAVDSQACLCALRNLVCRAALDHYTNLLKSLRPCMGVATSEKRRRATLSSLRLRH